MSIEGMSPTYSRPSRDETMIRIAAVVSLRGTCERAQVGAVIARAGRIISTGYVGSPPGASHCIDKGCQLGSDGGCVRTIHAEANAIAFAAVAGTSTNGATLYTTHAPCISCAKLIASAGINRVVWETAYRSADGLQLLHSLGIGIVKHGA